MDSFVAGGKGDGVTANPTMVYLDWWGRLGLGGGGGGIVAGRMVITATIVIANVGWGDDFVRCLGRATMGCTDRAAAI